jgi:hypothetical protein
MEVGLLSPGAANHRDLPVCVSVRAFAYVCHLPFAFYRVLVAVSDTKPDFWPS